MSSFEKKKKTIFNDITVYYMGVIKNNKDCLLWIYHIWTLHLNEENKLNAMWQIRPLNGHSIEKKINMLYIKDKRYIEMINIDDKYSIKKKVVPLK